MVRSLEGERVLSNVTYEMMRASNQATSDMLYWRDSLGTIQDADRPAWERFTRLLPFGAEIEDFIKQQVYCRLWRIAWSCQAQQRSLESIQRLIELARQAAGEKSYAAVCDALDELAEGSSASNLYDRLRYPDELSRSAELRAVNKAMRAETDRSMAVCAIALKRHALRHGEFPLHLNALVPEFLAAVPVDYMDGKPLRYHLDADGAFTLYSVGENLTDDGGDVSALPDHLTARSSWLRKDYVWPEPALPEEVEAYREEARRN